MAYVFLENTIEDCGTRMNTWVIGDIHGCYHTLRDLMDKIPTATNLVFVGDLIDRGPWSKDVVTYVKGLVDSEEAICLKGNHELMACTDIPLWMYNGGKACIDSYKGEEPLLQEHIEWFKTLPLYHETEDVFIVHAGVDPEYDLDDQYGNEMLWIRAKWLNSQRNYGKRIIFGHTPMKEVMFSSWGHVGIDTGCIYGYKLTAYCVETGEILSAPQNEKDKTNE